MALNDLGRNRYEVKLAARSYFTEIVAYLLDDDYFAVLGRTLKRHQLRLKKMRRIGARDSDIAKSEHSFPAFASLDESLHKARAAHIFLGGDRS